MLVVQRRLTLGARACGGAGLHVLVLLGQAAEGAGAQQEGLNWPGMVEARVEGIASAPAGAARRTAARAPRRCMSQSALSCRAVEYKTGALPAVEYVVRDSARAQSFRDNDRPGGWGGGGGRDRDFGGGRGRDR